MKIILCLFNFHHWLDVYSFVDKKIRYRNCKYCNKIQKREFIETIKVERDTYTEWEDHN